MFEINELSLGFDVAVIGLDGRRLVKGKLIKLVDSSPVRQLIRWEQVSDDQYVLEINVLEKGYEHF